MAILYLIGNHPSMLYCSFTGVSCEHLRMILAAYSYCVCVYVCVCVCLWNETIPLCADT